MHPLHDPKFIELFSELPNRRTGRTTAAALQTIAAAIINPGIKVYVVDHHKTHIANIHMLNMIRDMIAKLEMQHIHCVYSRGHPPYIIFERRT